MGDFAADRFQIGYETIDSEGEKTIDVGFRPVSIEINADYHQANANEEYHSMDSDDDVAKTMSVSIGYGLEERQIVTGFYYYSDSSNQHHTYEGDEYVIYIAILNDRDDGLAGKTMVRLKSFTDTGFILEVTQADYPINFTYKVF